MTGRRGMQCNGRMSVTYQSERLTNMFVTSFLSCDLQCVSVCLSAVNKHKVVPELDTNKVI